MRKKGDKKSLKDRESDRGIERFFDGQKVGEFFLEDDDDSTIELPSTQPLIDLEGKGSLEDEEADLFWEEAVSDEDKLESLYFGFDKRDLDPEQKLVLSKNVIKAKKIDCKGNKEFTVEGHACHSAGSRTYNIAISQDRAANMANELKKAGVKNVTAVGRGTDLPVVVGGDRDKQGPNRRAEISIRAL